MQTGEFQRGSAAEIIDIILALNVDGMSLAWGLAGAGAHPRSASWVMLSVQSSLFPPVVGGAAAFLCFL